MPGARILLVEDDDVLRDLIQRNLEARGHDVMVAADAQSALTSLGNALFDLVFLDICLPDQTGWEVLRTAQKQGSFSSLNSNGYHGQLPVVVLSAVRASTRRLQEFHPLAYLPKPFPMEAILRLAAEAALRRNGETITEQVDEEEAENVAAIMSNEEEMHA